MWYSLGHRQSPHTRASSKSNEPRHSPLVMQETATSRTFSWCRCARWRLFHVERPSSYGVPCDALQICWVKEVFLRRTMVATKCDGSVWILAPIFPTSAKHRLGVFRDAIDGAAKHI